MYRAVELSLTSKIVRTEGNIVSDMDGEKVMLNIAKGKYYNLGGIGGEIWGLIGTPVEVKEIIASLVNDYDVDTTTCKKHVLSFVNSLIEEGLIRIIIED